MIKKILFSWGDFVVSEYYHILSLYQQHRRYERKLFLFSLVLLVVTSLFVFGDFVRMNPFFIYLIAMGITFYYASRIRVEGKNYQHLKTFLRKYDPEILNHELLVFFIDYQLTNYFADEFGELLKRLKDDDLTNDEKAFENLETMITEIKKYYEYLSIDHQHEEEVELSLQWYKESIEKRKQNLL